MLLSCVSFAQFKSIELGVGVEGSLRSYNTFFEVENRHVVLTRGSSIYKLALIRLSHSIKKYEITHVVSLTGYDVSYDVSNPDYSNQYSTKIKNVNLGYNILTKVFLFSRFFPKSKMELLGGLQGNLYFEKSRKTRNLEDEVQENVDIAKAVNDAFRPTMGFNLMLQSNPQKRFVLRIGFHQQLTSYLGSINYNSVDYSPPKRKMQVYNLFLTYKVFKPKAKTE